MSQPADLQPSTALRAVEQQEYRLCFADFEFDVASGELHRNGTTVTIQPQPAMVLQHLAERPGKIVSRRELQQHVWGDGHFVDYEQGLNYCIKAVRQILGESADKPRFIETIPRRGYRFKAPVRRTNGALVAVTTPQPEARGRRWLTPAATAFAAVVAVVLGVLLASAPRSGSRAGDSPRLAVLPLNDFSGNRSPVLRGLTDELISQLAQDFQGQLAVIARSSSSRYADDDRGAAEIGAELGVEYLLTGSVQRGDAITRVSMQLVRVTDETNLWGDVYDQQRADSDWARWSNHVTAGVGSALELSSAGGESSPPALSAELYDQYLEGLYYANGGDRATRARGLTIMKRVLEAQPDFASAILVRARLQRELEAPLRFIPEVDAALRRAIELDPGSADAHLELARLQLLHLRDRQGAERSVRKALQLSPRLAKGHHTDAMVLSAQGRHEQAFDAMRRALIYDPLSPELTSHHGWAFFLAGEYERAIEHSLHALEIDPTSGLARLCLLHSALELGDEATALEHAREFNGPELNSLEDFWQAQHASLSARSKERGFTLGAQAIPLIRLGRHEEAIETLLRACREGSATPIAFAEVDPRLDPLRDHPRFSEVLQCSRRALSPTL